MGQELLEIFNVSFYTAKEMGGYHHFANKDAFPPVEKKAPQPVFSTPESLGESCSIDSTNCLCVKPSVLCKNRFCVGRTLGLVRAINGGYKV